ncbi:MAG: TRAP transporter large permease subunit [Hyphomicrobiaceae bacterium]
MELFFLALLIIIMAGALGSGFPVAFALPGSAIITILLAAAAGTIFAGDSGAYFASGGPTDWLTAGVTNFRGVYWEVERDTLIAIPLFVFMGIMLQRSKIAEDLLLTMAQLFGPVAGGLGISVVFVGALLAATTGILGATVVAMGLISLPAMLRNNYSTPLATGTIAAAGTLGQIIPPSIVLIILADQLSSAVDQASTARQALYKENTGAFSLPSEFGVISTSAGDMFLGALVPGLVLVGLFMLYILVLAMFRPKVAPSVPFEGSFDRKLVMRVFVILVPPLTLIFAVLGSIILGIATVNQAGAIGAIGASIMAGYRLKEGEARAFWPAILAILSIAAIVAVTKLFPTNIRNIKTDSDALGILLASIAVTFFMISVIWSLWRTFRIEDTLRGVMLETAKTTSLVFIILLGAAMLTAAFRAFGGEELVKEFLTSLPGGFWVQFVIVMGVIFVLGFFLDFIEIAVVVVPIVAPILLMDPSANITAVWLGVMIGLNIQTSFLTPPFGFALFYLRGVAPSAVKTIDIYKGVVPFIALQLIALFIVGSYPPLVNYLPSRISLLSETAPPPVNPRLQHCMEKYVFEEYKTRGTEIRAAITAARNLPLDVLPRKIREPIEESFGDAEGVFGNLDKIRETEAAVLAKTDEYRPLHREVRGIERQVRRINREIRELRRGGREADTRDHVKELEAEKKALLSGIPERWKSENAAFAKLNKAEQTARRTYRSGVDSAYEPVRDLVSVLDATQDLASYDQEIAKIAAGVTTAKPAESINAIKALSLRIRAAKGASKITSQLSKARRLIKKGKLDDEKLPGYFEKARKELQKDVKWRKAAAGSVLPDLKAYEEAIRDTIGLRQQPRLPRTQALEIASCNAVHRDISLSF